MSLQVLSKENGMATILIPTYLLKDISRLIENIKTNQDEADNTQYIKFLRRVIPFFMNQFLHWANNNGHTNVVTYLKNKQRKKKSKQKKFECGDLHKIFSSYTPADKACQGLWQQFLQKQAYTCVSQNNKISSQYLKEQYIDSIQLLKIETQKCEPYKGFLSTKNKHTLESESATTSIEEEECCDDYDPYSGQPII